MNGHSLSSHRAGRCRIIVDGEPCQNEGAYEVWFEYCAGCMEERGWLFCVGHPACVEHAAESRLNRYESPFTSEDVFPMRVASL